MINHAQTQRIKWADGQWAGTAWQPGFGDFTMTLKVDPEAEIPFVVDYSSLNCGGHYTLQKVAEGTLWLRQDLEYGTVSCVDQVTIALTRLDRDHITFSYWFPGSKEVGGFSTLTRVNEK